MGQKIHPGGLRVGVIHDWKSNWMVGKKEFAGALIEDIKIREHILKKLSLYGKGLDDYSLETVKMFYDDAQKAGFTL